MRSEDSMKAIDPLIARPREAGLLLLGFKAWAAPTAPDSRLSLREELAPNSTRAVWDLRQGDAARVAVTATEYASVRHALKALASDLEANQLAQLPPGPPDLGEVSFVHPDGVPPAVFFVRGNLTLGVFSFGRERVDVVPFARAVDADLLARPREARDGGVDLTRDNGGLRATPRWSGADGYVKVLAPGADLRKEGDLIVGATGEAEVFYIEPGRETYSAKVKP